MRIAVVGAGINGLCCATRIQELYPDYQVDLIAKHFSPNTTADGSGGLWLPHQLGDTPKENIAKWGAETYKFLHELWLEGGHDVCFLPVYYLYGDPHHYTRPDWSTMTYGYKELDQKRIEKLCERFGKKYVFGFTLNTFLIPPPKLMKLLHERFDRAGGKMVHTEVPKMSDPILEEYDVVVNCTGLGAKEFASDPNVFPVRGQITKVYAPWVNEIIIDNLDNNYIIPHPELCTLGGTAQINNYSIEIDKDTSRFILNGCKNLLPSLKYADVMNEWAGLRPRRTSVRLEAEECDGRFYIHNYGHGGSGMTLFWGCATDVLALLNEYLNKKKGELKSKL